MLKIDQLRLEIGRAPEEHPVEVLAPNRPDQSCYEGMRKWHVRNSLDFRNLEYPQVGLPLVESTQRSMIRAEVFWQTVPANRSLKHPAQRHPSTLLNQAGLLALSDHDLNGAETYFRQTVGVASPRLPLRCPGTNR
jgi:hypothetical protein